MARNYKREYKKFHSKPEEKKRRAGRNAARRKMASSGAVSKGDKKMSTIKTETLITTGEATFGLNLDQRTDREKNEFK